MKPCIYQLLLLLISTMVLHARLGETEDQCITRYGHPLEKISVEGLPAEVFEKGDFLVCVEFLNARAASIAYFKRDHSAIDDDEKEVLRLIEGNNSPWILKQQKSPDQFWARADGASCMYCFSTHELLFDSSEYWKQQRKQDENKIDREMNGL